MKEEITSCTAALLLRSTRVMARPGECVVPIISLPSVGSLRGTSRCCRQHPHALHLNTLDTPSTGVTMEDVHRTEDGGGDDGTG